MRWALLGIAAMLLVIFIFVILPGTKNPQGTPSNTASNITARPESATLAGTVGQETKVAIEISSANEIEIFDVRLESVDSGLKMNNTCASLQRISKDIPCQVNLTWTPASETVGRSAKVLIEYGAVGAPKDAAITHAILVSMNADAKEEVIIEEKFSESKPSEEDIIADFLKDDSPAPVQNEESFEDDYADDDFSDDGLSGGYDYDDGAALTFDDSIVPDDGDACYRFAFVGYNVSGQKAGWIRPHKGQYLFHPFSDTKCKKPTGIYNMDTGFIHDIKDRSKKIGSDAERVRDARTLRRNIQVPELSNPPQQKQVNRAQQLTGDLPAAAGGHVSLVSTSPERSELVPSSKSGNDAIISSAKPYDRRYVLRQFKPIPATIVSDIRVDQRIHDLPIVATVERNVYSDNERTIIVPVGTMLLGYVDDTVNLPGPYKTIGRITVCWYQMIRPDGVEFHLGNDCSVYAADSQGRVGVPGRGSTDYLEEIVIPMAAGLVPAAVNLVAPISDRFVNQIDLNNNTVTQSGQMRSSELAKQEIIKSWDKVSQRLFMDMMDNLTPPFTIPAGTRITVLSSKDLIVNWDSDKLGDGNAYTPKPTKRGTPPNFSQNKEELVGQVRSTTVGPDGKIIYDTQSPFLQSFMNQANQYQSQYQAQQGAYWNQQNTAAAQGNVDECGNNRYLNLRYIPGTCTIMSPSAKAPAPVQAMEDAMYGGNLTAGPGGLMCDDGTPPDTYGCCPSAGEEFVNEDGGICCLISSPDECFPPLM
jgi:type IV secretory pathway VirB10-like protein